MGIVRFALRFPHTFYVMAVAMLFLGVGAVLTAPRDIFPRINIPVVTVIWQYTGLTPDQMEQRVTTYSEYSISSNVNNIRNIESQTLTGIAVEKIFFQPNVNVELAISQIVSASDPIRALMPNGIQPNSLQPGTRTLLTEVDVDNSSGELRAGLYCTVRLSIPRQQPIIVIPSQAVVFNDKGLSAAIDGNGIARLRHLDLARDDGANVEVRSGLNPGDRVLLSRRSTSPTA
jgi:hypothetical protein